MMNGIQALNFRGVRTENAGKPKYIVIKHKTGGCEYTSVVRNNGAHNTFAVLKGNAGIKSGITRAFTSYEAEEAKGITPENLLVYIDLLNAGISVPEASKIARSDEIIEQYRNYTEIDEQGNPKSGMSRALAKEEAVEFILRHRYNPAKLNDFILLKNAGFDFFDTHYLLARKEIIETYKKYTQNSENGELQSGLVRNLTPVEALTAIKAKLKTHKYETYMKILDDGIPPEYASQIAAKKRFSEKYFDLRKVDEDGKPKSHCTRILTPDEALYAILNPKIPPQTIIGRVDSKLIDVKKELCPGKNYIV